MKHIKKTQTALLFLFIFIPIVLSAEKIIKGNLEKANLIKVKEKFYLYGLNTKTETIQIIKLNQQLDSVTSCSFPVGQTDYFSLLCQDRNNGLFIRVQTGKMVRFIETDYDLKVLSFYMIPNRTVYNRRDSLLELKEMVFFGGYSGKYKIKKPDQFPDKVSSIVPYSVCNGDIVQQIGDNLYFTDDAIIKTKIEKIDSSGFVYHKMWSTKLVDDAHRNNIDNLRIFPAAGDKLFIYVNVEGPPDSIRIGEVVEIN